MDTENADIGTMEAELRQWSARLDNLLAMADMVGTGTRIDYHQRLDDAREKYAAAEAKLGELKAAGRGKWEIFRGVEDAWNELATALTRLAN
jgi:hypothetical protein